MRTSTVRNSGLPGLLGMNALRKNRAVLDINANKLYFLGPGGYDMDKRQRRLVRISSSARQRRAGASLRLVANTMHIHPERLANHLRCVFVKKDRVSILEGGALKARLGLCLVHHLRNPGL